MSAKKQRTNETVVWPTIDGVVKICDGVDKPILQTLATVCAKLYDEALFAAWTPMTPTDGSDPVNGLQANELDQLYELSKPGGQYSPKGGTYYTGKDGKAAYTNGTGDVIKGSDVFNHLTKAGEYESLAQYGTVIDGITDFHGVDQAAFPPFAALVVQPKDETEVRSLLPEDPSTRPPLPTERECCPPPAGPHPHPRLAWICHGAGLDQRCRVLSHSLYVPSPLYTHTYSSTVLPNPQDLTWA